MEQRIGELGPVDFLAWNVSTPFSKRSLCTTIFGMRRVNSKA